MANSDTDPTGLRTSDSWIEISSRPSNSSLSSAADDAILPSPYSRHDARRRRGRLVHGSPLRHNLAQRTASAGGSSQDEYEESESESDRVMTSSNEGIHSSASESGNELVLPRDDEAEEEDDEDERGTALGIGHASAQDVFTPQPNAFTHPPSYSQSRSRNAVPGSYFPSSSRSGTAHQRHSYPGHTRQTHSPFNALSPSHQPDHDAALRASLNTLLSCAAARKKPEATRTQTHAHSGRVEESSLRVVPEYVALGLERPTLQTRRISSTPSSSQRAPSPAVETHRLATGADRSKRAATRATSKERQRIAKKPRRLLGDEVASPTLLTWVVSAGVLVLVSALSFSAGYKVGRDSVGLDVPEGASCAREAARSGMGLRRLHGAAATA